MLERPYDFNWYLLAPFGTRAIIYKDSDVRASWAPHGLDAWYLGPSKDHYCCHHYCVPRTMGYRISGSANLFSQHCQEPLYSHYSHIRELSPELQENMLTIGRKAKTLKVLKLLARHLDAYISGTPPPPPAPEQRVGDEGQTVLTSIGREECLAIQMVSYAPPTMLANNPTSKGVLQAKVHTHQRTTRHNTPGALPKITHPKIVPPLQANTQTQSAATQGNNAHGPTPAGMENQNSSQRHGAKTINLTHIWQPAHQIP
jgi:hypothetical protein